MISSSLVSRVPPWNTTLRAPPERLVSSSHIHLKAVALDSGGGVTWGKSSFFAVGLAWPAPGLRPPDSATATSKPTATAPKSRPGMSRPPWFRVAPRPAGRSPSRLPRTRGPQPPAVLRLALPARDGLRRAPPRLDFGAGQLYHPRAMRGRLSWIGAVPHVAITLLMVVVIVDMLIGVFLRYVMTWISATFDLPTVRFFWVEEVGEWSLAWLTFIGAALGVRRGTHFAVHLLIDRFPAALRKTVLATQCLLIVAFGALVAVFGWQVAELNSQSFSPALGLNLRWPYLSSVVGGVLMVGYGLITPARVVAGRRAWCQLSGDSG